MIGPSFVILEGVAIIIIIAFFFALVSSQAKRSERWCVIVYTPFSLKIACRAIL